MHGPLNVKCFMTYRLFMLHNKDRREIRITIQNNIWPRWRFGNQSWWQVDKKNPTSCCQE